MIPFRKRNHKQVDHNDSCLRPLKQKSTNIRRRQNSDRKYDINYKVTTSENLSNAVNRESNLVFDTDDVLIRLMDNPPTTESIPEREEAFNTPRRLSEEITELSQQSIQLEDFDQPPYSTSTPLVSPTRDEFFQFDRPVYSYIQQHTPTEVGHYLQSQRLMLPIYYNKPEFSNFQSDNFDCADNFKFQTVPQQANSMDRVRSKSSETMHTYQSSWDHAIHYNFSFNKSNSSRSP